MKTYGELMTEMCDLTPTERLTIMTKLATLERGHHVVLGLTPGATRAAVTHAYLTAAKVFHPDRFYGRRLGPFKSMIDEIFLGLTTSYKALSVEVKS